jgi:hypothetical protein
MGSIDIVGPVWKRLVGPEVRLRCNFISGSKPETLSNLRQFGLRVDHVHSIFRSEQDHRNLAEEWLQKQRAEEGLPERQCI